MKQHKHNATMEEMKTMKKKIPRTIPTISAVVKLSAKRKQAIKKKLFSVHNKSISLQHYEVRVEIKS